jgi:predicted anti-sigma-YlaC factor YlaD
MRPLKVIALLSLVLCTGCIRKFAINKLGDALAGSGTVFASDDDPELIASAAPFSLKLMESLLAETPNHTGLLLAASRGFTQYAFAFVQAHAEEIESDNFDESSQQQARARRLYLRARDYGLRGIETRHRGFREAFGKNSKAVSQANRADVALLYWTAASWGAAIAISKDRPELIAEQPMVEALIDRAFELDASFESGAIHGFLISYEPSRAGGEGDPYVRSRSHFDQAVRLSGGQLASPYIALAETVAQKIQDRQEFESLLQRALAIDINAKPEWKLENLVMQRRAHWLLSRMDELFVPPSSRKD